MVEPITIGIGAAICSAIITGLATYFAVKQPSNVDESKLDSRGEIYNNVHLAVQENNNQNNTLVLLLAILVLIKFIEIVIYCVNVLRRGIKRRYQRALAAPQILPAPANSSVRNPTT